MEARPANYGELWTRDELILAIELYCRIPFQRTKSTDPRVQELALLLERSPGSVARKLGNLGSFDPHLAAQDISGLSHGSKLDRVVWNEFYADWAGLVLRAAALRRELEVKRTGRETTLPPAGPSEAVVEAKRRLHQAFFRDAVISSYNSRCCVTGLPIVQCLVAGHIVPWRTDERRRADPTNGLCMSATFDRLFDCGLLTIAEDLTIKVSERLRSLRDGPTAQLVASRHGQPMFRPTRFQPDPACLRWHRDHVFDAA